MREILIGLVIVVLYGAMIAAMIAIGLKNILRFTSSLLRRCWEGPKRRKEASKEVDRILRKRRLEHLEHLNLEPRSKDAWGHAKSCLICYPSEFGISAAIFSNGTCIHDTQPKTYTLSGGVFCGRCGAKLNRSAKMQS